MSELDLSAQSLPAAWQSFLAQAPSLSLKAVNNTLTKQLLLPHIATISEIEKLQIALQVSAFYTSVSNEELAQNILSLLLDTASQQQYVAEFVCFLTSVAASTQCILYLQSLGLLCKDEQLAGAITRALIHDNCVASQSYGDLIPLACSAPQFVSLIMSHLLQSVVQDVINKSALDSVSLKLALQWCMANPNLAMDARTVNNLLFAVTVLPSHNTVDYPTTEAMFDSVYSTLLRPHDVLPDLWENISQHIDHTSDRHTLCDERLSQLIVFSCHSKRCSKKELGKCLRSINKRCGAPDGLGGMLLSSLAR